MFPRRSPREDSRLGTTKYVCLFLLCFVFVACCLFNFWLNNEVLAQHTFMTKKVVMFGVHTILSLQRDPDELSASRYPKQPFYILGHKLGKNKIERP